MGIANLTDVGCVLRLMRRAALEKIISKTTRPNSDVVIGGDAFSLHLTMLALENDLRLIEVPVTFNSRLGYSKTGSNELFRGIKYGLKFMRFIVFN
jgi:ribosomal protein L4